MEQLAEVFAQLRLNTATGDHARTAAARQKRSPPGGIQDVSSILSLRYRRRSKSLRTPITAGESYRSLRVLSLPLRLSTLLPLSLRPDQYCPLPARQQIRWDRCAIMRRRILMPTRLSVIDLDHASEEQRVAIEEFSSARGGTMALGDLYGMIVNSPEACRRLSALGAHCRYGTGLSPQMTEAAILGAVHGLEFAGEVRAHQAVARAAGMTEPELSSLASGTGDALTDDLRVAAAFTRAAVAGAVSDDVFEQARAQFSPQTLVDLAVVAGYYSALRTVAGALDGGAGT